MMRPSFLLLATALALTPMAPANAQSVVPVQFDRGASSTSINGVIRGRQYIDYRIVVRRGQQMSVALSPRRGSPYFNVIEPGAGDVAIFNSSTSGQRFSGMTQRSGAYTIRVYQMRASGRRGEVATYGLDISVSGGRPSAGHPHAPSHNGADALVRGTPYHAVAPIQCRSAAGAAMGTCKAGVIRRPGSATVHLDTPDGGERTIVFRNGRAVSSDSNAGLTERVRGDLHIVRIGTVEIYQIPDVLLTGD